MSGQGCTECNYYECVCGVSPIFEEMLREFAGEQDKANPDD